MQNRTLAHKCIPPESSLVHRWTQTLARRLGCAQAAMPTSREKDMRAVKKLALKGAKPPRMSLDENVLSTSSTLKNNELLLTLQGHWGARTHQ